MCRWWACRAAESGQCGRRWWACCRTAERAVRGQVVGLLQGKLMGAVRAQVVGLQDSSHGDTLGAMDLN